MFSLLPTCVILPVSSSHKMHPGNCCYWRPLHNWGFLVTLGAAEKFFAVWNGILRAKVCEWNYNPRQVIFVLFYKIDNVSKKVLRSFHTREEVATKDNWTSFTKAMMFPNLAA